MPLGDDLYRCALDDKFCTRLTFEAKIYGRQRRKRQDNGLIAVVPCDVLALQDTVILHAAAAKSRIVRIQNLDVIALCRHADAIVMTHFRRKVADDNNEFATVFRAAKEGNNAVLIVIAVDPLEPIPLEVHLPECLCFRVELI